MILMVFVFSACLLLLLLLLCPARIIFPCQAPQSLHSWLGSGQGTVPAPLRAQPALALLLALLFPAPGWHSPGNRVLGMGWSQKSWNGLEGTLKIISLQPLPRAGCHT